MRNSRLAPVAVIAVFLLALPATAVAQSGTPGSDNASDGVYGGGNILGEEPQGQPETPGTGEPETPGNGEPGNGTIAGPGGDPGSESVPFGATQSDSGAEADDDVSSLPFTGFYAVLALGVALGLIVVGLGVRLVGDRATREH